ncbi:MAG: hypothetical protein GC206_09480 [Alphaproteobacteria bacterium]|nr:hypothetical protein [Alphaproteobacteria bacterium]
MRVRVLIAAFVLSMSPAACDRATESAATSAEAPMMDAPVPDAEPGRAYRAVSDSARSVTGRLTITLTTRMPDPASDRREPVDYMSLRAETGLTAEGVLSGAVSPGTSLSGQTIRALMDLDVRAPSLSLYRVESQNAPRGGRALCEDGEAQYILVWESFGPGEQQLRVLPVAGGAPGAAEARACAVYAYSRDQGA